MTLSDGARTLLADLRTSEPVTRAQVGDRTGWSRGTVNIRIDELLEAGLLRECGVVEGGRGRPAALFALRPDAGELLVADVGASGAQLAVCDLTGGVLARSTIRLDIAAGPDAVLGRITDGLHALEADRPPRSPWGVAVGLPGPIQYPGGRVVSPPIMTGWDGVVVPERLQAVIPVPVVVVENDANAMAWGERCRTDGREDLLFVKVGTGVGVGIVANGEVLRGARGAAGDLGHTWVEPGGRDAPPPLCRCGKTGCLEAYAGGWAIARDLTAAGRPAATADDVVALVKAGDARSIQLVRAAGQVLGIGLAHAVSLLNPSEIVVGGPLSMAGEHLLAGIRQHVAARSLPLATGDLRIRVTSAPDDVGIIGLADALTRRVFQPDQLAAVLGSQSAARATA